MIQRPARSVLQQRSGGGAPTGPCQLQERQPALQLLQGRGAQLGAAVQRQVAKAVGAAEGQ